MAAATEAESEVSIPEGQPVDPTSTALPGGPRGLRRHPPAPQAPSKRPEYACLGAS